MRGHRRSCRPFFRPRRTGHERRLAAEFSPCGRDLLLFPARRRGRRAADAQVRDPPAAMGLGASRRHTPRPGLCPAGPVPAGPRPGRPRRPPQLEPRTRASRPIPTSTVPKRPGSRQGDRIAGQVVRRPTGWRRTANRAPAGRSPVVEPRLERDVIPGGSGRLAPVRVEIGGWRGPRASGPRRVFELASRDDASRRRPREAADEATMGGRLPGRVGRPSHGGSSLECAPPSPAADGALDRGSRRRRRRLDRVHP